MTRFPRRLCALLLCASVVLLSPGLGCYQALALGLKAAPARPAGTAPVPKLAPPWPVLSPPQDARGAASELSTPALAAVAEVAQSQARLEETLAEPSVSGEAASERSVEPFDRPRSSARSASLAAAEAGAARAPALLAPASSTSPLPGRLIPFLRRAAARPAAAWSRLPALTRSGLLLVGLVVLAHFVPGLAAASAAAPLVMATCNSMREKAIKDSTILPQERDEGRRNAARQELDAALVDFGKRVRAAAQADAAVQTAVRAHDAEHAMEEPLLELLPEWKRKWAEGASLDKEAALAQLRSAVLKRLKDKALPRESEETVERLLIQSGGWEEFLAWEKRYDVIDALRAAAQSAAQKGKTVEVQRQTGISGVGGATLGMIAFLGVGLLAAAALGALGGAPATALILLAGTIVADAGPKAGQPVPLESFLKSTGLSDEDSEFLREYTNDLGARDFAPVVGRSKEIQRVITILSKPPGTQNNPMLLGDKGVGKTAIVEAVARYLYENRLPSLSGKRILELDVGKLAAGTKLQGELEERLTKLRSIAAKTNNRVVLFIDEIHSLLKNNTTSNAVPDLLKAPLRNGDVTVIGATTVGEFRQYVEKDPAFADRFDSVMVNEPTPSEAIEMLEGDLEYLEKKFGAEIDPEAAQAAVRLSARYIPEKFLPRKARVLLENAISEAKPAAARDGLQVQIDQLADRLRLFARRYAASSAQGREGDKAKRAEVVRAHNRIVAVYQTILSLEERQKALREERIAKSHVLRTLAKETGLDVAEMGADDYARFQSMVPWFKDRVVGQDEAVSALAEAVRRNKSGLADPNRPLGVFLFPGKTGVGKTEIARRLAEFLFNDPKAMARIDMSEYMEKFSAQRLIGAPPGYVGYEAGGELTEKVRRKPYSIVLLDEIEKAHPDVLNTLLQVFEDGRLTDGKGNTVDFKNTIIIMTSNLGSSSEREGAEFREDVMAALKARLRPEFINRLDKIVIFNPLDLAQAEKIVGIQVDGVRQRLRAQDLELIVSPAARAWLAKKGFNPAYGARPIKRTVESQLTDRISEFLLAKRADGTLLNGGVVEVSAKDDGSALVFDLKANPPPDVELSPLPEGPLGAKLRAILQEAVRPDSMALQDQRAFDALLFPERVDVVLKDPLGAFEPDARAPIGSGVEASERFGLVAEPGARDPELAKFSAQLDAKLEGRWNAASREAASAWIDGFSELAKRLFVPSGATLGLRSFIPSGAGQAVIALSAKGALKARGAQGFLRLARDHFSVPLPDEAAVRQRAGALKDLGAQPDRQLLEVKRLVESVPGAKFGFDASASRLWLSLPVSEPPAAQPPAVQPPDADANAQAADGSAQATAATVYQPGKPAPTRIESWSMRMPFPPKDRGDGVQLEDYLERQGVPAASQDLARLWLQRSIAALANFTADSDRGADIVIGKMTDGALVLRFHASPNYDEEAQTARLKTLAETLEPVVSRFPGASFGHWAREDGKLGLWLKLPAPQTEKEPASAQAPLTTLDARSSPAQMLRFLTQGAPAELESWLGLTQRLLASESDSTRLLGLHMAGELLPAHAYQEISAASRGLRISDAKDGALFAELAARVPGTGMSSQRAMLSDSVSSFLTEWLSSARQDRSSTIGSSSEADRAARYAQALARSGEALPAEKADAAWRGARELTRFWITRLAAWIPINVLLALVAAYGWIHYHHPIISAIAGAIATLILWAAFSSKYEGVARKSLVNASRVESLLAAAAPAKPRRKVALRWLKAASRGRLPGQDAYYGVALEAEQMTELLEGARADAAAPAAPILRSWASRLDRHFSVPRERRKESQPSDASLAILGHLHDWVPASSRKAVTKALLAPMQERAPSSSRGASDYFKGLGAWLEKVSLDDAELDSAIQAFVNFPAAASGDYGWTNLLPGLMGLARQPRLTPQRRAAVEQLVSALASDNASSGAEYAVEAARVRGRLSYAAQAWDSLREPIGRADRLYGRAVDELPRLIAECPPDPLQRAWLEPALRKALRDSNGEQKAAVQLALARLADDPREKAELLLSALIETEAERSQPLGPPLYRMALDELHALAAARRAPTETAAALDRAVEGNLARLEAFQP